MVEPNPNLRVEVRLGRVSLEVRGSTQEELSKGLALGLGAVKENSTIINEVSDLLKALPLEPATVAHPDSGSVTIHAPSNEILQVKDGHVHLLPRSRQVGLPKIILLILGGLKTESRSKVKFGDLLTEIRDVNSYPTKAKDVGSKLTKLSKKGFVLRTGDKGEYLYELTIAGENEFSRVLSSRSTEDGQSQ